MSAPEVTVKRGWAVRRAGFWDPAAAVDRVVLDAGDRHRRRIMLNGAQGTPFLLDLDEAVALRDGDGIMLDDGTIVLVTGQAEPLAEIAVRTPLGLMQMAWHLGNRHTDVQIVGDRLRIRRDHVLEEMAVGRGAAVTVIDAPFDPEAVVPQEYKHEHTHDHDR
ncbi:MAG: urease accessory protein UreE [Alphaproteobacteria bacterium]|nr:urease accessory protein UreE [Alphaproteobacteria bacterium]